MLFWLPYFSPESFDFFCIRMLVCFIVISPPNCLSFVLWHIKSCGLFNAKSCSYICMCVFVCVCVCMFVCAVTRKYEILMHSLGYGRRQLRHSGHQRTRVVSKYYRIVEVGEAVFLSLTFLKRWYGHGRTSLSISHLCVSGGANLRLWLVPRKEPPRNANTWKFSNYGN